MVLPDRFSDKGNDTDELRYPGLRNGNITIRNMFSNG